MSTHTFQWIVSVCCCLAFVGPLPADDDRNPLADDSIESGKSGASKPTDPSAATAEIAPPFHTDQWFPVELEAAIRRAETFLADNPANKDLMDRLLFLSRFKVNGSANDPLLPPGKTTAEDRRKFFHETAKRVAARLDGEQAGDNAQNRSIEVMVEVEAQLLAQLDRESTASPEWQETALAELQQREEHLGKQFPTLPELAAAVGLERLRITSIPGPGSDWSKYWNEGPQAVEAFLKRYPETHSAAQAAFRLANAYEVARNSPQGLAVPDAASFDPVQQWCQEALRHKRISLWGGLAAGSLRRLQLVGTTLEVSGTLQNDKPMSLQDLRGKPVLVVFFQPEKLSPAEVAELPALASAVRGKDVEVLGVRCYDQIARGLIFASPLTPLPKPLQDENLLPVITEAPDFDSSYSGRFGITVPKFFVLVDETGKVVRTQLSEIKDLDEFLGLPKPTQRAATPSVKTSADQPTTASTTEQTRQPVSSTIEFPPRSLQTAIDQLPEAFRNNPANGKVLASLTVASRGPTDEVTTDEQRQHLQQQAKDAAALIIPAIPHELHLPLARQAAGVLAQLYRDSHEFPDWQAKALADLEQLESRLAREFPTRIELASQVGIERLWCRLYSVPPEQRNESNPDSPQLTSEFIERYPHTAAAAQAAYLAATQYERWALAHLGPNYRPRDDVPEMDEDYFQQAVEQSPNSIWGKAAAGALRRIRLVGQTLQVSGHSLDGKFLSLKQFRGNREVVVFFRPGKSSWGAVETPDDFADAVRRRGFDVLGVLCHLPTAAPDEIAEYVGPASKDGPHMPLLVDSDDVDTSNSVRYGLTVQRLFVLVDATGKVVRTATDQVKDIDGFLGPSLDTWPAATAIQPENTTPAQPSAFSRDDDTPAPKTGTTPAQPPAFSQDAAAARQPSVPAAGSPLMTKIFHLQNGVAADYSKLLQDIFTGTKLTADPRTNAILAAGEEQNLQKIEALLRALDESKTKPAVPDGSAIAEEAPKSKRIALAFTATWAGPCQQILPVLRSIADLGAPIQFVDVDREPELAKRHQITSIPAVIIEEDGREVERLVGVASRQKLEKLILGRVVTNPDAPAPARSVAAASFDPFAVSQRSSAPVPSPSRSQPPGLLVIESRAAELAHKVRELTNTHDSEHTELIAARQLLEQTLAEALELKFRSEQHQVATLEQRLTRLKSQLDQRKAVQSQIVERRMRELLETPATRWNTDEPSSDSVSGTGLPLQATDAPSTNLPPPVQDQIVVDLYATDGIYQNDKLIAAVVAPLNKLTRVVANVRMIPGDGGKFVFAIVHNAAGRFHDEATENRGKSPTKQAIEAALKAGGINDVRWEGVADEVASDEFLPSKGEAATAFAAPRDPGESPVVDRIFVHLYEGVGSADNKTVVDALNKLAGVDASVRIIPLAPPKLFFAQVLDPPGRMQKEAKQSGKESATRQAIEATLRAAGIEDVRWQEAFAAGKAVSVTPPPVPEIPAIRKPAEPLEASARLTLDLAEAEADIRETEAKLAIQVKLQARGVITIDEVTSAMQRRDRAVRKRQILLDEFVATVKDLELQLASAKTEYEGAVTMAEQTLALFHLARVSMREVTDANVRRTQADLALQRLQNRFELLKKAGEKLPGAAPGTEQLPADTPAPPAKPSPDPQPVKN